jgi:hypothetical protein
MVGMGSKEPDSVLDWEELCALRCFAAAAAAFLASRLGKVLPLGRKEKSAAMRRRNLNHEIII